MYVSFFAVKPVKLITAVCENNGIGANGGLPWKLKNEMAHFASLTTKTSDARNVNAVVMGRRTWESVPPKFRPFPDRLNVVITGGHRSFPEKVLSYKSVEEAIKALQSDGFSNVESIWIIGGHGVYKETLDKKLCDKLYVTRVNEKYDCDVFFPVFNEDDYHQIEEEGISGEKQVENGVTYYFQIFQKVN